MRISFSTLGCPDFSWVDIYTMAKDFKFDGIEIRGLGENIYAVSAPPFTAGQIDKTIAKLASLHLSIPCLSTGRSLKFRDEREQVVKEIGEYLRLAEKLSAPYIRLLADLDGPVTGEVDDDYVAEVLLQLADMAKGTGVTLLCETNGVYADTKRLRALLDKVNRPEIAALWDMHHPYRYFGEAPQTTVDNLGGYIRHVHTKDSVMVDGKVQYRMMGEGDLPITEMLDALASIGYEGYVSLEWVKRWMPDLTDAGIVFPHFAHFMQTYSAQCLQTDDRGTKETPCFFDYEGRGQVKAFAENYRTEYETTRELGYAAMPTCSHDIWRLNRFDRNTPEQLKTALTLFLTLPAVPILYYGEEIGMRNLEDAPVKEGSYTSRNRSSCRTPMQWDDSPNAGFSTADASRLYLPIDPSPARPTVAAEERDPQSILNYVKGLIALRRQTPALGTQGAWRFVSDVEQPYPMVYARELDGQKYLVALNPSKRSATARFASEGAAAEAVYGTGDGAKYTSKNGLSTLKMKPVSAVILKITE